MSKTVPEGSGAEEMRGRSITLRDALTIGSAVSAWTNNPHTMRVWVRIQHGAKGKIAGLG